MEWWDTGERETANSQEKERGESGEEGWVGEVATRVVVAVSDQSEFV